MATVDVLVPQMGEGLQEVRIVALQKQPGDFVKRDEPLYSMETDKAVMEVESPFEGVLTEWLAAEDQVLEVGAVVARMDTSAAAPESAGQVAAREAGADSAPAAASSRPGAAVSPRTRAYGREKGLSDEELARIPAASGKLMPADIDAYLAGRLLQQPGAGQQLPEHTDIPMSRQQRTFVYRLKRSAQTAVPAVAKRSMTWRTVRRVATSRREQGADVQPSAFQTFAYCVAQTVKDHPRFRSAVIRDDTIREYAHLNLGIAVGTPDGELTTAVVRGADTLAFDDFIQTAQAAIQRARDGDDQADDTTQVLLTYMGPYDLTDAVPVLVAPAAAVLFVGTTFEQGGEPTVNLSLTFEHRLIHGIEAAQFLRHVVDRVEQIETTLGS